jgi:hypothetical protein
MSGGKQSPGWKRASLFALILAALLPTLFSGAADDTFPLKTRRPKAPPAWVGVDPEKIIGTRECSQCHRSETLAWMEMSHYESHLLLLTPGAKEYARAVGIDPNEVRQADACTRCHATTQTDARGQTRAVAGVSCESCHGESGGEDGWLNTHAVYGPNETTIEQESSEHRAWRLQRTRKAGMIQSNQIYETAQRCLNCHLVRNEALVNAGHSIGREFELAGRTSGEVQHNFHENPRLNADGPTLWARRTGASFTARRRTKFVVGLLAELESSLLAFSRVRVDSDYSQSLVWRAESAWTLLKGADLLVKDDFPGDLKQVVTRLANVEDLDGSSKTDREKAAEWAQTARTLARKYAAGDGSSLRILDSVLDDLVEQCGAIYKRK